MNKKNKKTMLIVSAVMFVVVLFVFVTTVMHYWPYWFGLQNWELYSNVEVSADKGGFDLNTTALTMGIIKLGGASRRTINFTNDYDFPVLVKISAKGNITYLLQYETPVFVESGEKISIKFQATSTRETPVGEYEGFVKFKAVPAI